MDIKVRSLEELNNLCRLCLTTTSTMFSIYNKTTSNETEQNFAQMITECTSIQIQPDDNYPKSACLECLNTLENFFKFKQRCKESHAQLNELINNIKMVETVDSTDNLTAWCSTNNVESNDKINDDYDNVYDNDDIGTIDEQEEQDIKKEVSDQSSTSVDEEENYSNITDHFINDSTTTKTRHKTSKETNKRNNKPSKYKRFTCDYCSKTFALKCALIRHKENCENQVHTCDVCLKKFNKVSELRKHQSEEHTDTKTEFFKCDLCDKALTSRNQLLLHFQLHLSIAAYFNSYTSDDWQCYICVKEFKIFDHLWTHILTHYSEKATAQHSCQMCKISLATNMSLGQHIKRHGVCRFTCNKCLISYPYIDDIKDHIKSHANETAKSSYCCEMCKKTFVQKKELKMHLKEHSDDLYKCLVCSQSFSSLPDVTTHYGEHDVYLTTIPTTSYVKSILCPVCGKLRKSNYLGSCYNHLYQDNKFMCDVCQKTFNTKLILKQHKRTHDNYRPYACSYCDYRAGQSNSLKAHIRIHTGERPFKCEFPGCGKTFIKSGARLNHMRRHTDERNFQCDSCPARFTSKTELKNHTEVHLNIFRHPCDMCDRKFRRLYRLKEHKQKTHKINL